MISSVRAVLARSTQGCSMPVVERLERAGEGLCGLSQIGGAGQSRAEQDEVRPRAPRPTCLQDRSRKVGSAAGRPSKSSLSSCSRQRWNSVWFSPAAFAAWILSASVSLFSAKRHSMRADSWMSAILLVRLPAGCRHVGAVTGPPPHGSGYQIRTSRRSARHRGGASRTASCRCRPRLPRRSCRR